MLSPRRAGLCLLILGLCGCGAGAGTAPKDSPGEGGSTAGAGGSAGTGGGRGGAAGGGSGGASGSGGNVSGAAGADAGSAAGAGGSAGGAAGAGAGGAGGARDASGAAADAARPAGDATPPPAAGGHCTPVAGMAVPNLRRVPASNMPIAGATEVAGPPDQADEIWVLEHFTGRVRVVKGGTLLPQPVAQVSVRQSPPGREQGLLSIAFSPDYKTDQLFYLFYSAATPLGQTTVDEFKRTDTTASMRARNVYAQPHSHQFHNGGSIAFSPKDARNMLYISIGDNQADGGPAAAQMAEGLYGRIRRINLTTREATTWDRGLRNPYRFSFDAATGDLYIGDVGDGGATSEKLFFSPAGMSGRNWGWRGSDNRMGVVYLDQVASDMGAVIGGFVYRGRNPKLAGLCGRYVYGHLRGQVWSIRPQADGTGADKRAHATLNTTELGSLGVDANGELYVSSLNGGVWRIDAE